MLARPMLEPLHQRIGVGEMVENRIGRLSNPCVDDQIARGDRG
jgi:hypothetical protein